MSEQAPGPIEIGMEKQGQLNTTVNKALQQLFEVPEATQVLDEGEVVDQNILFGKEPDTREELEVGHRKFGAEWYLPSPEQDAGILVVTEHGYGGRARDFSKLAELLNADGMSVLSLDMHADGKDDFDRMSMRIDEWADVAIAARQSQAVEARVPKLAVFVGQSSGGTAGAELLTRGKGAHRYDGAILIGPTLVTAQPEVIDAMNKVVKPHLVGGDDAMVDWNWLGTLTHQLHNPELNRAYVAHLASTPGMPYMAAREAVEIDRSKLLDRLNTIDVPVLLTKGAEDHEDDVSIVQAQQAVGASHEFVKVEPSISDAGHQAHIEQPQAVAALIHRLVETLAK